MQCWLLSEGLVTFTDWANTLGLTGLAKREVRYAMLWYFAL